MRYQSLTASAAIAFCILPCLCEPAAADRYTIFDVSTQASTYSSAINASGAVAGYFQDVTLKSHGYVRATDGTISEADAPRAVGTQIQAINDSGWFAGSFQRGQGGRSRAFLAASPRKRFHIFDVPGALSTSAMGLDAQNRVAGTYSDDGIAAHGYLRQTDGSIETFDPEGSIDTETTAISPDGIVIGHYSDAGRAQHAFLRTLDGTVTIFDAPDAAGGTMPKAMNEQGFVAGDFTDATSRVHGFLRKPDGSFATFDPRRSILTDVKGINVNGLVCGVYYDKTGHSHGFTRALDGTMKLFDPPGSDETEVSGINADGITTGYYYDKNGWHGFLRKP